MDKTKLMTIVKWVAAVLAVLILAGLGIWAYEIGKEPISAPLILQAAVPGAGTQEASSGAAGAAAGTGAKEFSASAAGTVTCPGSLGLTHAQDAANVAAAGRAVSAYYGVSPWTAGLTGIAYRCSLIGKPALQRSYGFFMRSSVPGAIGGIKYSWYDNGGAGSDQYTKISLTTPVSVVPASGWAMSSAAAINDFLSNGGLQYYRDELPQSSGIELVATLSMNSSVPLWNVTIQTWLPSGAPGPLFTRAYNAVTGLFCGNADCGN